MMASAPVLPASVKQPLALTGVCKYHIDHETLHIDVEQITNNRAAGTRSGSLSLEMWALAEPYTGGDFRGYQLAAMALGELEGQRYFGHTHYSMALRSPAEGSWYLVLMLREWDCGSYVTRDFISFPQQIKAQYKLVLSLDGLPAVYRP